MIQNHITSRKLNVPIVNIVLILSMISHITNTFEEFVAINIIFPVDEKMLKIFKIHALIRREYCCDDGR
jgi:hypothetical protein